ncbi:hypothetical protein Harman_36650 [Haloarcula mannanilytica]|uniref:Uncharacterized protein n=1 Tax=Haloarcula mannanilytica TaxID=2509225 RepID=A0A4C2EQI9_9EURY|nr:hypothetical protein [Haloarcula mannanilytica]GCF15730.1 hypothetical protein Harman_36650 [Haloarcula mannanilytica]
MPPEPEGLPLTLLTGESHAVIYEANGFEIVPWYRKDWGFEGPGVEYFPNYVKSLVKYYERPEELWDQEKSHLEHRPIYDQEDLSDIWFEPETLPDEPIADQSEVEKHQPFSVIIDDDAPFPDDETQVPDHEVRIEDSEGAIWYLIQADEYDAYYRENEEKAPEAVADFTTSLRLMYEKPEVFVARYTPEE